MSQVLLIEPDRLLAKTYAETLAQAGHQVSIAGGAQAAISAADQQRPDVVLLELQLVEHSGIEFLYEFRSYDDWRVIPIIIHSHVPPGEFDQQRQLLQRDLGVQAYLYKPATSLVTLLANVQEFATLSV